MHNSTETFNDKTRHKNNEQWIYSNIRIIPTSFRPVQTLWNLVPEASSLFGINPKKVKRPWRWVGTLSLRSRPPSMQGLRVLFWMWIISKISAIILFKRNRQKKTFGMHTHFILWTTIFLFVQTFYTSDDSQRYKKNK